MSRSFFYGTDAQLYTGSQHFADLISADPTAYGLNAVAAAEYVAMNARFAAAYLLAINPDTRTRSRVNAKNVSRDELRAKAADLAKIIDGTSTVTDAQKIDLGLNVRKRPTPVVAPTVAPGVAVVSMIGRTMTLRIFNAETGARRKVEGAACAWVYTFVGEEYPADPTMWQFMGSTSKSKYVITLPNTVAGGTRVWVAATWVTFTGLHGPISMPISTYVQGGSVSSAGGESELKIAA